METLFLARWIESTVDSAWMVVIFTLPVLAAYGAVYRPGLFFYADILLALQNDWCTWRDCEASDMLSAENRVIEKVLKNWSSLKGVSGGALLVGDAIVAYTVAEKLGANTLVIHFEKGNPDYKGVYQAINQMFLERFGNPDILVNREQDLGDDGLRKAKLSYHPVDYLKKFRCVL